MARIGATEEARVSSSPMTQTILAVDDDEGLLRLVQLQLEPFGYKVVTAASGEEALELFQRMTPELVILDVGLPKLDGLSVCRRIRSLGEVPVLMLSAFSQDNDRIVGLEVGADDYLGKPYNPRELLARVRALLRRSKMGSTTSRAGEVLSLGTLVLNPLTHEVAEQGELLSLTPIEFSLLKLFMSHSPHVLSREKILTMVWGASHLGSRRLVDTHVGNLRKKLAQSSMHIVAVRGVGFKLVAAD